MINQLLQRFIGRMRFPWLFGLTAIVAVVNFLLPDPVPLFDEVLLALLAALVGSFRKRGGDSGDEGGPDEPPGAGSGKQRSDR